MRKIHIEEDARQTDHSSRDKLFDERYEYYKEGQRISANYVGVG